MADAWVLELIASIVDVPMLKEALEALKQRYPHHELGPDLIRFHEILKRTTHPDRPGKARN